MRFFLKSRRNILVIGETKKKLSALKRNNEEVCVVNWKTLSE